MKIFNSTAELRLELDSQRRNGLCIGLVPTMGNLHAGHLRLVEEALRNCDFVVSTIFVNPLQFSPDEDLQAYPRTLKEDQSKLVSAGCHYVLEPSVDELFGSNLESQTTLHIPSISNMHCGKRRSGHFDGVATVVCKLFNIVNPSKAFFGLKDYQQFLIIQKLVADLAFEIDLVGVETVREENGLALSSRNSYLSKKESRQAATIFRNLNEVAIKIQQGQRDFQDLEQQAIINITEAGLRSDYFSICHAQTLEPATNLDSDIVILAAAYLRTTRLIDNIRISL